MIRGDAGTSDLIRPGDIRVPIADGGSAGVVSLPEGPIVERFRWPVPIATRHREYTVTNRCYLIEAGDPCDSCTLVSLMENEAGILEDPNRSKQDPERIRINVPFVTGTTEAQLKKDGTNLVTHMGGEPLTITDYDKVVSWVVEHPTLNIVMYSSSAYLLRPDGRSLNDKGRLYEGEGLFSPRYGHFKCSVDQLIIDPKTLPAHGHPHRGDAYKSLKGLQLAEFLKGRGHEVAIHQTLKSHTIKDTLALYKWAKDRDIGFTICPTIYAPYVSNGKSIGGYPTRLTENNKTQVQEIVDEIVGDTIDRYRSGEKRIYRASSAFTRLIPDYGINNSLSCRVHRQGIRPNTSDVHPNGTERWCIAQDTAEKGQKCSGSHYIGMDRGESDYWHFEHLAGLNKGDVRFLNADVWIKDPNYDPTGRNLFFDTQGNPLN